MEPAVKCVFLWSHTAIYWQRRYVHVVLYWMGLTKSSAVESKLGRLSIFIFHAIVLLVVSQLKSEKKSVLCYLLFVGSNIEEKKPEVFLTFYLMGVKKKKKGKRNILMKNTYLFTFSIICFKCMSIIQGFGFNNKKIHSTWSCSALQFEFSVQNVF